MDTDLAPGYGKITYSGFLFPHHMIVPVKFHGTPVPGTEPSLDKKGATFGVFSDVMDEFITTIAPLWGPSTHFGLVEAHTVDPTTGEDTFIWGYNQGTVGTGTGANTELAQQVLTYKSVGGSVYKLYAMEALTTENTKVFPPYGGVPDTISDYLIGASSPVYARGNFFLFSPISMTTKTNDALRKQHGLS